MAETTLEAAFRPHLLKERGMAPGHVHTRGYWKLGEVAYPDHDYGAD
jgi:NADPH-dependent ferric siderophore reductase